MTTMHPIHSQNRVDNEMIDLASLVPDGDGAQPTYLASEVVAYVERCVAPDGQRYDVTYGFEEDGDDLPFDSDHVVRVVRVE